MVFGLFSRKQLPQESPIAVSDVKPTVQLRTPSPSEGASIAHGANQESPLLPDAPEHLSPAPDGPEDSIVSSEADLDALLSLLSSVPPKTLHAYTLKRVPSCDPQSLSALADFFCDLTPPPLLHCVRCHKDYVEVENDDRSCLIAHDDDSAEVERVAKSTGRANAGGGYETLWGCCGKTVEGHGDMGPPDGWCYEGKHTSDIKRARFRADSTVHQDKLISCLSLDCHGIRSQLPRTSSSTSSPHELIADNYSLGGGRKRRRSTRVKDEIRSGTDDISNGASDSGMEELTLANEGSAAGSIVGKGKGKAKAKETGRKSKAKKMQADKMDVDGDAVSVKSLSSVRKPRSKAALLQGARSDNEDAMSTTSSTSASKSKGKPVKSSMKPRSRVTFKSRLGQVTAVGDAEEDTDDESVGKRKKRKVT